MSGRHCYFYFPVEKKQRFRDAKLLTQVVFQPGRSDSPYIADLLPMMPCTVSCLSLVQCLPSKSANNLLLIFVNESLGVGKIVYSFVRESLYT